MAQKILPKFWLLWFLFSASTAFGASLSCVDLFAGKQRAITKIDTFVSEQLRASGFEAAPRGRTSTVLRFRSALALRKLNFALLANERYRADQVEKLIDLQISRSLSPINDLELALKPSDRASVRRLIMRQALERGLFSLADQNPSVLAQVRKVLNRVLSRPEVRVFTKLQLPTKTVELSRDQVDLLLSGRTSRLLGDSEFRSVVNAEGRVTVIKALNRMAVRLAAIVLFAITYQQLGEEYDQLHAKAVKEKTDEFKEEINKSTSIDATQVAAEMAEAEKHEVLKSFREKFKSEPTPQELQQIRSEICVTRYGQMLKAPQVATCMAN